MDLGGSQLCGMLRLSFSQVVGVTGRLGAPLSRKVVVALGEHWAGGQFETDVRAGRLQRQHSSTLILIRPRGFVGAITRREKRKRGCREKSWQTAGRLVDKKYKETDRRWLMTAYIPNAQVHFPELCTTNPQLHMHPKPTHPLSQRRQMPWLLSKAQTQFTESRSKHHKHPSRSIFSSVTQLLLSIPPLKMALSNRGSQKDLRLPSIFAKLFPPTKLQRGTGVDHVTSSQPRGLLFRLCTHLSRCGGACNDDSTTVGVAWR